MPQAFNNLPRGFGGCVQILYECINVEQHRYHLWDERCHAGLGYRDVGWRLSGNQYLKPQEKTLKVLGATRGLFAARFADTGPVLLQYHSGSEDPAD